MITEKTLKHMPDNALVEENQGLLNTGEGVYAKMPAWHLKQTNSVRIQLKN
jgi:hypothetical protein